MATYRPVGLHKVSGTSSRGTIVTKHPLATAAGHTVLESGGNALDAAIAAAFTLAVVEPYMSGLGGVGLGIVAGDGQLTVLDGGPVSPRSLDPAQYQLDDSAPDADLFGWPRVSGDTNLKGAKSVCVPTVLALLEAIHRQGARLPWSDLIDPAIRLACDGFPVDWGLALNTLHEQEALESFPTTAAVFLPGGRVPRYDLDIPEGSMLRQPALAATLETIAREGAAALYGGALGDTMTAFLRAEGGALDAHDLASYTVRTSTPMRVQFGGVEVWATDGLNGGPTVAEMLWLYEAIRPQGADWNDPRSLNAWIDAASRALEDRFTCMGHAGGDERIGTREHAESRMAETPRSPVVSRRPDSSTTYLAATDGEGRAVSMNLTLLSGWGSKLLIPDLGILMNNGVMWFDPVPGRANSIAPGARALANMAPVMVTRDDRPVMLVGATGGRRIMSAVAQILSSVWHHGMGIQEAIGAPRVEFSTDPMLIDSRFGNDVIVETERLSDKRLARMTPRLGSNPFAHPLGLLARNGNDWSAGMEPTGMGESAWL